MFVSTALLLVSPALAPLAPSAPALAQDQQAAVRQPVVPTLAEDPHSADIRTAGILTCEQWAEAELRASIGAAPGQPLVPLSGAFGAMPSAFGPGMGATPAWNPRVFPNGRPDSLTVVVNGMVAAPVAVGENEILPLGPGWTNISLPVDGYTQPELAIFGHPGTPHVVGERPLLVVCHRFSNTHADVFNTGFYDEAIARGWFVLSPLSRSTVGPPDVNYASETSQIFTETGMNWVLENYPIDRNRIYGVGFSMGASQCLSYAARHMDPKKGMFAALVNHTGSVDQVDTWNEKPGARPFLETLFGGTPTEEPFAYRNASVMEVDELTGTFLPGGTHQISNLASTPMQLWWATMDPEGYLSDQTEEMGNLLTALNAPSIEIYPVVAGGHIWDLLPYGEVCDWFDLQELVIPTTGRILADRDGRWLHFDLTGVQPNTLAGFSYTVDLGIGVIEVRESEGIDKVNTNLKRWNGGVGVSLPLTVKFDAIDAGDTIVLRGVVDEPLTVTRNGMPQATGWSYDALAMELTVTETETGPQGWIFDL